MHITLLEFVYLILVLTFCIIYMFDFSAAYVCRVCNRPAGVCFILWLVFTTFLYVLIQTTSQAYWNLQTFGPLSVSVVVLSHLMLIGLGPTVCLSHCISWLIVRVYNFCVAFLQHIWYFWLHCLSCDFCTTFNCASGFSAVCSIFMQCLIVCRF